MNAGNAEQGGAFVDVDGQKVLIGDDYEVGPLALGDVWKLIESYGHRLLAERSKDLTAFAAKLKTGDTSSIILVVTSVLVSSWLLYHMMGYGAEEPAPKEPEPEPEPIVLRDFTIDQLREFIGANGKPIYVGLKGEVFDVSRAPEHYGPGAAYDLFAGRDTTRAMAKLSFEEEDLANPDVSQLNPFEKDALEDWVHKFKYYKQYPVVGRLSYPEKGLDFTPADLAKYTGNGEVPAGRVHAPVLVSVRGDVYDVSFGGWELYGPEGPYAKFAGKDVSRALAKMSFEPDDIDSSDISSLTEQEAKVLSDWVTKLRDARRYPVVGRLVL